jgi:UDP:flavonoid glycosyltransferase YjiC (YdhE family)
VRILFTTMPGTGHLYPMLPLVRAAQRAGHEVVIATASDLAAEVRTLGLPVWEVGPTFAESFAELARSRPVLSRLSEHDQTVAGALGLFGAAAARRAPGLLELASDWHPGLVIHEMTELSGAVVADQLRVPHVVHGLGPHQPGLAEAMRAVAADLATRFDLPDFPAKLGSATYLDVCPPALQPLASPPPWSDVQALRPSAGETRGGERLAERLSALPYGSGVFVSLGTLFHDRRDLLNRLVEGTRGLSLNVIVSTGPGVDTSVLGAQPAHVLVEPFVAQGAVMPHCVAMVSHGGAATMLSGLSHGVPQVCVPLAADQGSNARELQRCGASITIEAEAVTAERVANAVDQLVSDAGYATAAASLRDEIDQMPPTAHVLDDLLPQSVAVEGGH